MHRDTEVENGLVDTEVGEGERVGQTESAALTYAHSQVWNRQPVGAATQRRELSSALCDDPEAPKGGAYVCI